MRNNMTTNIQAKYNELRLKKERVALLSYLKENYQYFGSNLRIFGALTDKTLDEIKQLFESYDILCELEGEILQCKWTVTDELRRTKKYEFFCNLNTDTGVLQIFTFIPSSELYYLERIIKNTSGLHYLWISPKTLDEIRTNVLSTYTTTLITQFTAKRFDNMKETCAIRPGFQRNFRYHGEDGRETLQELRNNYGVLPRTLQFKIPQIADFRVSFKGMFTFNNGNLDYVISLFQFAIERIISTKRVIESSVYRRIKEKRRLREVNIEEVIPLSIKLSSALDVRACYEFVKQINDSSDFYNVNEAIVEGSLYFASTLFDRDKNETFKISSNGDTINIVKDSNTSFASLLKFYQFVVERLDIDAEISL